MMLIVLGLPVAVMMKKLGSFYVCVFPHEKRVAAAAVAVAAANTDLLSVTTKQAAKRVKFAKHDNPIAFILRQKLAKGARTGAHADA